MNPGIVKSKSAFALLVTATMATWALISSILPMYLPQALVTPAVTFGAAISGALVVYLTVQEQGAPA